MAPKQIDAMKKRVDHLMSAAKKNKYINEVLPTHIHYAGQYIRDYDEVRTENCGWMYFIKSTAFTMGHVRSVVILSGLAFLFGWFSCSGTKDPSHTAVCIPLPDQTQSLTLAGIAAFLGVSLLSKALERWFTVRRKIGRLIELSTRISFNLHTFVRPDSVGNALNEIDRYLKAAHSIAVRSCQYTYEYQFLVEEGLLTQPELDEIMKQPHKPRQFMIVYTWIAGLIRNMNLAGQLDNFKCSNVTNMLQDLMGTGSSLISQIYYPFPYAYFHMFVFVIRMYLFQVFFVSAGLIGAAFYTGDPSMIFTGYMTLIMNFLVYRGILNFFIVIRNPMGFDANDFPQPVHRARLFAFITLYSKNAPLQWPPVESSVPDASWWKIRLGNPDGFKSPGPLLSNEKPNVQDLSTAKVHVGLDGSFGQSPPPFQ